MTVFIICNIVAMWACLIYFGRQLMKFAINRQQFYDAMANPAKIMADMERSAEFYETLLPEGRTDMPRKDQTGQPAQVHRPRQNGPRIQFGKR